MPEWVIALISAALGVVGVVVPAWMRLRHERRLHAREAASVFLGRLNGVSDAVGYALGSCEADQLDDEAIRNANHLAGEFSTEVGRSLLLLKKGTAPAASAAYEELRRAAWLLRVHRDERDAEKKSGVLMDARAAYNDAQKHQLELIEFLQL